MTDERSIVVAFTEAEAAALLDVFAWFDRRSEKVTDKGKALRSALQQIEESIEGTKFQTAREGEEPRRRFTDVEEAIAWLRSSEDTSSSDEPLEAPR